MMYQSVVYFCFKDLASHGGVNIVKTLTIFSINFCFQRVRHYKWVDEENIIFDYIWKYINPKLRETTLIETKNDGGFYVI